MAERGPETLRHGPMKPMGLDDPRTGRWPYTIVQLRQDNALGTLWNMVGFQTKLKHGEQLRIFRSIPGLENAEFRTISIESPQQFHQLAQTVGQRTSLESKTECPLRRSRSPAARATSKAPAVGLLAARFAAGELRGDAQASSAGGTAIGALLAHITGGADAGDVRPDRSADFGLMPPIEGRSRKKADRKKAYTDRARAALAPWLELLKVGGSRPSRRYCRFVRRSHAPWEGSRRRSEHACRAAGRALRARTAHRAGSRALPTP